MSAQHYAIVAETTADLRFQFLEAGSPINLFNVSVELVLSDKNGDPVVDPGIVTIVSEELGRVQFEPKNDKVFDAAKGPYLARWLLTDASGKVSPVPTGHRDVWEIIGK
jgi:hypothetical protein